MSRPTLPKLAALAEEHLEGFKRPAGACRRCEGRGYHRPLAIPSDIVCLDCGGYGRRFDDSPEALIAAVVLYCYAHRLGHGYKDDEFDRAAYVRIGSRSYFAHTSDNSPEGIARAMLIALLFAHGIKP